MSELTEEPTISGLHVDSLLQDLQKDIPETDAQRKEKKVVKFLQQHNKEVEKFLTVVHVNLSQKMQSENTLTNKDINTFYSNFHQFMSSVTYKKLVRDLFQADPDAAQYNVSYQLCVSVRKNIVSENAETTKQAAREASKGKEKKFSQSDSGKGKVRYIGGWVISSVKKSKRAAKKRIMYKRKRVKDVEELILQKDLLEHLTASELILTESSDYKETLHEITRRQNLRRGLTHISDECVTFFMELDTEIRKIETSENLHLYGKDFPSFQHSSVSTNEIIKGNFRNLFKTFGNAISNNTLDILLSDIISKYLK